MHKKSALILFSAAGALALGFTSVLQAAAGATGTWRPYGNTNPITSSSSTWKCQSTKPVTSGVSSQVCTIRSRNGGSVQGAVIVRNNNSYLYSANADMYVYYESGTLRGNWYCSSSGVAANSWSVCFGKTFSALGYKYYTSGYANNKGLGTTGYN
jgi:hypothetical protein